MTNVKQFKQEMLVTTKHRSSLNLGGITFTVKELHVCPIQIPEFFISVL